jgi:hypothetical protein
MHHAKLESFRFDGIEDYAVLPRCVGRGSEFKNHAQRRTRLADICRHRQHGSAALRRHGGNLLRRASQYPFRKIGEAHLQPHGGEAQRGGEPGAAGRAGNNGDAARLQCSVIFRRRRPT